MGGVHPRVPISSPSLRAASRIRVFAGGAGRMGKEGALQASLVALAVVVIVVGAWTFSFKKMMATYFFGLLGIAGILLPDWEFFDRDFSQWFTPMPGRRGAPSDRAPDVGRFKFYPLRVAVIAIIYGFGLYKWWMFVSS